ncbi:MAG: molybdenum cofactor carrier [Rhodospirillaceae bacterium]|nr:molybdenum cofactor carrier [Rhodospirillaceae bacterium]|tara:strand:- start:4586 stop:5053 length:468 start_codon:yes stop_codon:yes gene_type:complete
MPNFLKICSGGQTGVDRAALDAAIACAVPHVGWCPKGRLAEDGVISDRYLLTETEAEDYYERTRRNATDSDATLIFSPLPLEGGTALTADIAHELEKPVLIVEPANCDATAISDWIRDRKINVLNIAGPRESENPGIYASANLLFLQVFEVLNQR